MTPELQRLGQLCCTVRRFCSGPWDENYPCHMGTIVCMYDMNDMMWICDMYVHMYIYIYI